MSAANRALAVVCALLCALLASNATTAWAAPCPSKIEPDPDPAIGYAFRDGRCEGLFKQRVAASADLVLVGAHLVDPKFPLPTEASQAAEPIPILAAKSLAEKQNLRVRVLSRRPSLYYRMDAGLPATGRLLWPRDVINQDSVHLVDAQVLALVCVGTCDSPEPKIVPVQVGGSVQDANASSKRVAGGRTQVKIWFRAGLNLKQLNVRIERNDTRKVVVPDTNLLGNVGVLPAAIAIGAWFSFDKPGAYRLSATAVPDGESAEDSIVATLLVP